MPDGNFWLKVVTFGCKMSFLAESVKKIQTEAVISGTVNLLALACFVFLLN